MVQIRLANQNDIPEILAITAACNTFMRAKGIFQWTENYPSRNAFEDDVSKEELFVLEKDTYLVGCIVISNQIDSYYETVKWLTETTRHVYIHRLAVHPDYQGNGYAHRMMDFAEDLARKKCSVSVRLDTFSKNTGNQNFYERRGYQRLGEIFFPEQSEHPFYCYELIL